MAPPGPDGFQLVVHGGAGSVPAARREAHREGCARAAQVGASVLAAGGSALDAVVAAVRALEDDPEFNAGTGACLNEEGVVEHDASVMEGTSLAAGAICALRGFREPIEIARRAMEDGRHVLYAAEGAARFAEAAGFQRVDPSSLVTEAARRAFEALRDGRGSANWAGGTVGAVARDARGRTASATSTGGMVGKRVGRVGDSPILGAGTYADDEAGAVSTTGHGESMMRLCVAFRVVEAMRVGAAPVGPARDALAGMGARFGTAGGLIAIDRAGEAGLAWTTETMSWGAAWGRGAVIEGHDAGV